MGKKSSIIGIGAFIAIAYIFFWWWFFQGKNVAIGEPLDNQNIQGSVSIENDEDAYVTEVLGDFRIAINTQNLTITAPIVEGVTDADLAMGVGHHKTTAVPGLSGNVVLSGHRWKFGDNPYFKVFEDLDQLHNGDHVTVHYNNRDFVYEVYESMIVDDDAIEIFEPTSEPTLTLYTCTPKYTAFKRLVFRARLIEE